MDSILREDAREFTSLLQSKVKWWEGKVLSFRNILKIEAVHSKEMQDILEVYDNWFDITADRKGKIN